MNAIARALALTGWRGRGLDALFGLISVLGHAPYHIWPLTILGFAWLIARIAAAARAGSGGFSRGFWFAFPYFLGGTYWIGSAFIARGPEFIPAMPPMIIGLALILALFWALAGWAVVKFGQRAGYPALLTACMIILAEFARGHVLSGFPWALPGYIFPAGGAVSQNARWIGIYGLSFLVLAASSILAHVFTGPKTALKAIAAAVVFFAGLSAYGHMRLAGSSVDHVDDVHLRIVQVQVSQADKFDRSKAVAIVNEYIAMSAQPGLKDVTHVIWPEGAIVGLALENRPLIAAVGQTLTRDDPTPPDWLLSTLRYEETQNEDGSLKEHYFNASAAIRFEADGRAALLDINDKKKLVPFGEFIPGGEPVEKLGMALLSTSLASITPAKEKTLSEYPGLPPVSPQICYEIIFSRLTPRPKDGPRAQWIISQSNDAWFGAGVGPMQHANIAAYRAIEEGVPIVRSASNGVSGVIDPYGRFTQKLMPHESGVIDAQLPKALPKSNLSDWHNQGLALILLILTIMLLRIGTRDG